MTYLTFISFFPRTSIFAIVSVIFRFVVFFADSIITPFLDIVSFIIFRVAAVSSLTIFTKFIILSEQELLIFVILHTGSHAPLFFDVLQGLFSFRLYCSQYILSCYRLFHLLRVPACFTHASEPLNGPKAPAVAVWMCCEPNFNWCPAHSTRYDKISILASSNMTLGRWPR